MIRFNNVHMQYQNGHLALKNINLHIEQGAMAFIAGRSGAGKSSMLRLIALIERHNRGQIIINGQNLERVRNNRIPYYRRNIGFVFQDHRLLNERLRRRRSDARCRRPRRQLSVAVGRVGRQRPGSNAVRLRSPGGT